MTRRRRTVLGLLVRPTALVLALGAAPAAVPAAASSTTQTVSYGGVQVQVPASWPVVDFTRERVGCLRLDRNAVYLGVPAVSDCPAHLVGAAQTVQLWFPPTHVPASGARNAHGLRWTRSGAVGAPGVVEVHGDARHATVTLSDAGDDASTRAIVDSVRQVGTAAPQAPVQPALQPAATSTTTATYSTGEGFDACAAPSVATMQAWLASPYRTVGVYTGGADRACAQPNLDASWVTQVTGMGWTLIPTYVGLQAPCWSGSGSKIDPANAATQGTQAATDAVNGLTALGLGPGNPVYDDMENYSLSNSSCVAAVEAFVDAWTQRLHALGYVSGFYSSAGSGITDMVNKSSDPSYHVPDDIWFGHWNGVDSTTGDSYVPDTLWANHQRIHQYRGGHDETYGGATINIDNDAVDGATATPAGAHKVTADVNGDGRSDLCYYSGVNGYTTHSHSLELHCLSGASAYTTQLLTATPPLGYLSNTRQEVPIALDADGDGRTDACVLLGVNGGTTASGKTEVHCSSASGGFSSVTLTATTPWPYLDTSVSYPVGLDENGDGITDLCVFTGINGHATPSGKLEVHCLDGASGYTSSLVDAVTPFGYQSTWAALPIGLDEDGDGRTDACVLTGVNGHTTPSGQLQLYCVSGATGYTGGVYEVTTSSGYIDPRFTYPIALDVNGDGRTDLCLVSGLNGQPTSSGRLEVRCLNGATRYGGNRLIGVTTASSYLRTSSAFFLADAPLDVDTLPPTVTLGSQPTYQLGALLVPYSATDSSSGVESYDVRYRVAAYNRGFSSYVLPTSWQATTATSVGLRPVRGATYCFSVRARDHWRNVSAWSADRCTAVPIDERSLTATSGWVRFSASSDYAGTLSRAMSPGQTLTLKGVQTHRLYLVATTCSVCGSVGVYWNGTLLKKLSLYSSTTRSQQLVGVTIFRGVASGTLTVRSLTSTRVFIDGVALSRL